MVNVDLVQMVMRANPTRHHNNLVRRLIKILEELGETSEAYLSVSSSANYKGKSWLDVREEAVDTMIVLLDVALTPFPNGVYPPSALLPQIVSVGMEYSYRSSAELERQKFNIVRAIGSAEEHFHTGNEIAFYGALARGIASAAILCYAKIPEDDDPKVIDKRVDELLRIKLDKWTNGLSSTADHSKEAA